MDSAQILNAATEGAKTLRGSFNFRDPDIRVNKRGQFLRVNHEGEPVAVVNSLLTEDEWVELEDMVLTAARYPLRVVDRFRSAGLVRPLGSVGSLEARWYVQSGITPASINMTGRSRAERDLPEVLPDGVPVPVIFKEFSIDWRTLEASRRLGDGLDMTTMIETTRVVAEAYEGLVVAGNEDVRLNNRPIYGLCTHPKRTTDTATNFGGGDWGTITNILPTVEGMINAANQQHNYGPFLLYVSQTQYNQAALRRYTDGSGRKPIEDLQGLAMVSAIEPLPPETLPDGELMLLQMTPEYMEIAEAMSLQVREWSSGDGTENMFKVLVIGTPKIKARYGEETGIVHATGA